MGCVTIGNVHFDVNVGPLFKVSKNKEKVILEVETKDSLTKDESQRQVLGIMRTIRSTRVFGPRWHNNPMTRAGLVCIKTKGLNIYLQVNVF